MSDDKIPSEEFCQVFMREICRSIYAFARGKVTLLRREAWTALDRSIGEHMLALHGSLDEEQLNDLEASLREVQFNVLGTLFSLIDGTSQPPGWPDEIRLVNADTGESICQEHDLEGALSRAMLDYQDSLPAESTHETL